jgi:myo-inositol-1(or 4)-monophosphatase
MDPTLEHVAVRACLSAGRELRDRFENGTVAADRDAYDVKDEADRAAEARILETVESAFPDHAIYAEESGTVREAGAYRWVIDPLDGTNNFVSGMPDFGTAAAVLDDEGPLLGVVYVPVTDDLYVAKRGAGVTHDGEPVDAANAVPLAHSTVGYVIGREVKRDERGAAARQLYRALDGETKRVVASWAPVVHWGLLARGRLEGMVAFHPNEEEQHVGSLLAEEAGASIRTDGPLYVAASDDASADTLHEAASRAVQ